MQLVRVDHSKSADTALVIYQAETIERVIERIVWSEFELRRYLKQVGGSSQEPNHLYSLNLSE